MGPRHTPIIVWFRRDLRLADHPSLTAAAESGRPVIPLFILDDLTSSLGAAPKWRLGQGLSKFEQSLSLCGSCLVLRRGDALQVLKALIAETGATSVFWSRAYDPAAIERDTHVKTELIKEGVEARSFAGHLLFEPWTVSTKTGQPFRVFTPMWRAVRGQDIPLPIPAPTQMCAPKVWPLSDSLQDWHLGADMQRGAVVAGKYVQPGEDAAIDRLKRFTERVSDYSFQRDQLTAAGTSSLSEYLSLGEISPRVIWHRIQSLEPLGGAGTEAFLRQLVWREFSYHLMYHWPHLLTANWKRDWDDFPWSTDPHSPELLAWSRARTGVPLVDAGLRQMYVTGRMHNRARMIVASYLTKHLMVHWKLGMSWFADCLIDWDPAANAMGWQWVAGSGPDAAPFFRIFNPQTQREKFDPNHEYIARWIAEDRQAPAPSALDYFNAVPRSWGLSPPDEYPSPFIDLAEGRKRALHHYNTRKPPVRN